LQDVEAQCRVGEQLQRSHQWSSAAEAYRTAVKTATKSKGAEFLPTAHDGLAVALASLREYGAALKEFTRVSNLSPSNARAYHNIGAMLRSLKRPKEAIEFLKKVVQILPNEPNVQTQLNEALSEANGGNASSDESSAIHHWNKAEDLLMRKGDSRSAIASYKAALQLNPVYLDAYHRLALAHFNMGETKVAQKWWDNSLHIAKGNAIAGPMVSDAELKSMYYHRGLLNETLGHKMKHDYQQVLHLIEYNKVNKKESVEYLLDLATKYKQIHDALPPTGREGKMGSVSLTEEEIASVGSSYNKAWNMPQFLGKDDKIPHAINPNLNFPALEDAYLNGGAGGKCVGEACHGSGNIMTVESLLTPAALHRLRFLCEHGTYWFNVKPWGYLGAYLNDGFHPDIVLQIARELPKRFPKILGQYTLSQLWAYKYDSSMAGIAAHTDEAAVNVNLWITPDEANLDFASGGMILHHEKAPLSWTPSQYTDREAVGDMLLSSDQGNHTVTYKANRAVFFDGSLFHQSDKFKFKSGYKDRRINLTFLFGERGEKFRPALKWE